MPKIAGKSNFCPNIKTETNAVSTNPAPAQMAYAIPSGISFRACDRKKKQAPYAKKVMEVGRNLENPSDFAIKLDPTTSKIIANTK